MSGEPVPGRAPAFIACLMGAQVALTLTLVGLLPESDFSVKEPMDLFKLIFVVAPLIPFFVLGGFVMVVKDRFMLTGLLVIAGLLILSCGFYLAAQAEHRVRPDDSMHALAYLVIPFLQTPASLTAFGLLALWRAWSKRGN